MDSLVDLLHFLFTELNVTVAIRVRDCAWRWGEAEDRGVDTQEVVLDCGDGLVEDGVDGVDYVIYQGLVAD